MEEMEGREREGGREREREREREGGREKERERGTTNVISNSYPSFAPKYV